MFAKAFVLLAASGLVAGGATGQVAAAPVNSHIASSHWSRNNVMQRIAQDLHVTAASLKADRRAGESLASIAQAHGSSASALEATLLAQAQARLNQAEAAGHMTAAQVSARNSHLSTMIDHLVTMTPRSHGRHQGGFMHQ